MKIMCIDLKTGKRTKTFSGTLQYRWLDLQREGERERFGK